MKVGVTRKLGLAGTYTRTDPATNILSEASREQEAPRYKSARLARGLGPPTCLCLVTSHKHPRRGSMSGLGWPGEWRRGKITSGVTATMW